MHPKAIKYNKTRFSYWVSFSRLIPVIYFTKFMKKIYISAY